MYIYNLILGLLLAYVAINLHNFSECKVLSSSKDVVDTATTAIGARAVAFTGVYLLRVLLYTHGQHINVLQNFVCV